MMIGLPGSGKSTWAKQYAAKHENTIIISQDAIRNMIKNNYVFDLKYEPFVKEVVDVSLKSAIERGYDIIIDETHISKLRRIEVINIIEEYYQQYQYYNMDYKNKLKIIYIWLTEKDNNLKNRMKEDRGYTIDQWFNIIDKMKTFFQPPEPNERQHATYQLNSPFDEVPNE